MVDDNSTNRRILIELLWRWTCGPWSLVRGGSFFDVATRGASTRPFRLVLTDVHMPGTDGFGLVERILQTPELAELLILMLTSGEQKGDVAKCRELGVAGYLIKPVRRAELSAAIVSVFSSRPERRTEMAPTRSAAQPAITGRELRSETPLRILLAEDNEINRRVAIAILKKRDTRL